MSKCKTCKKYDDCRSGSGLTWPCGAYVHTQMTNADRIRAMSDEELAEFLSAPCVASICEGPEPIMCGSDECKKLLFDWLNRQAEEDDHAKS